MTSSSATRYSSLGEGGRARGPRLAGRAFLFCVLAILTALFIMPAIASAAATSGPDNAGAGASVNQGGGFHTTWSNPGRITADDASYATCALRGSGTSRYLEGTNYGFAIPAGATINGIQVSIMRMGNSVTGGGIQDSGLYLIRGGTPQTATNRADTTIWPTSMTAASYGGSSDLWGASWTAADINATNFGVALIARNTATFNRTASVDYMQITVTYTISLTVAATGVDKTYDATATATVTLASADIVSR